MYNTVCLVSVTEQQELVKIGKKRDGKFLTWWDLRVTQHCILTDCRNFWRDHQGIEGIVVLEYVHKFLLR